MENLIKNRRPSYWIAGVRKYFFNHGFHHIKPKKPLAIRWYVAVRQALSQL